MKIGLLCLYVKILYAQSVIHAEFVITTRTVKCVLFCPHGNSLRWLTFRYHSVVVCDCSSPGRSPGGDSEIILMNSVYKDRFPKVRPCPDAV